MSAASGHRTAGHRASLRYGSWAGYRVLQTHNCGVAEEAKGIFLRFQSELNANAKQLSLFSPVVTPCPGLCLHGLGHSRGKKYSAAFGDQGIGSGHSEMLNGAPRLATCQNPRPRTRVRLCPLLPGAFPRYLLPVVSHRVSEISDSFSLMNSREQPPEILCCLTKRQAGQTAGTLVTTTRVPGPCRASAQLGQEGGLSVAVLKIEANAVACCLLTLSLADPGCLLPRRFSAWPEPVGSSYQALAPVQPPSDGREPGRPRFPWRARAGGRNRRRTFPRGLPRAGPELPGKCSDAERGHLARAPRAHGHPSPGTRPRRVLSEI